MRQAAGSLADLGSRAPSRLAASAVAALDRLSSRTCRGRGPVRNRAPRHGPGRHRRGRGRGARQGRRLPQAPPRAEDRPGRGRGNRGAGRSRRPPPPARQAPGARREGGRAALRQHRRRRSRLGRACPGDRPVPAGRPRPAAAPRRAEDLRRRGAGRNRRVPGQARAGAVRFNRGQARRRDRPPPARGRVPGALRRAAKRDGRGARAPVGRPGPGCPSGRLSRARATRGGRGHAPRRGAHQPNREIPGRSRPSSGPSAPPGPRRRCRSSRRSSAGPWPRRRRAPSGGWERRPLSPVLLAALQGGGAIGSLEESWRGSQRSGRWTRGRRSRRSSSPTGPRFARRRPARSAGSVTSRRRPGSRRSAADYDAEVRRAAREALARLPVRVHPKP